LDGAIPYTEFVCEAHPFGEYWLTMFDRADEDENRAENDPPRRRRSSVATSAMRRFVGFSFLGAAIGLVIVLVWARQVNYDPTPNLTPEIFEAAHERWKSAAPRDYDIEVRVTGPQAAVYRVEVRDGEPQTALRNGQPLSNRRTLGTWSVPGMFSTMSRDVEAIERAAKNGSQTPLILRAEFDAQYSYPMRYRRIDNGSRKGGDAIAVTWDVAEFRMVGE
jgi:hypothetical protein